MLPVKAVLLLVLSSWVCGNARVTEMRKSGLRMCCLLG